MRSSNKRSRNNKNRNRPSGGNIVNRVFDSSGPEGKVRGTPQQIIDKYNQLTRDAQLSNDRVAAENFAQHAEHYTRMLAEAQREMNERQQHNAQQHNNNQQNDAHQSGGQQGGNQQSDAGGGNSGDQNRSENGQNVQDHGGQDRNEEKQRPDVSAGDTPEQPVAETEREAPKPRRTRRPRTPKSDDVIETGSADDAGGLVETPEEKSAEKPVEKPRRGRPRKPKPQDDGGDNGGGSSNGGENQAAE